MEMQMNLSTLTPGQVGSLIAALICVAAFGLSSVLGTMPEGSKAVAVFAVFVISEALRKRAPERTEWLLAFPPMLASIYLLSAVL